MKLCILAKDYKRLYCYNKIYHTIGYFIFRKLLRNYLKQNSTENFTKESVYGRLIFNSFPLKK